MSAADDFTGLQKALCSLHFFMNCARVFISPVEWKTSLLSVPFGDERFQDLLESQMSYKITTPNSPFAFLLRSPWNVFRAFEGSNVCTITNFTLELPFSTVKSNSFLMVLYFSGSFLNLVNIPWAVFSLKKITTYSSTFLCELLYETLRVRPENLD